MNASGIRPIYEPRISGIERKSQIITAYMGWRTMPYIPVLTTFCPA